MIFFRLFYIFSTKGQNLIGSLGLPFLEVLVFSQNWRIYEVECFAISGSCGYQDCIVRTHIPPQKKLAKREEIQFFFNKVRDRKKGWDGVITPG